MSEFEAIMKRVSKLQEKSGLAQATISTKIFKDSKRIAALQGGARAWPTTLQAARDALTELEALHGIAHKKPKRKVSV